tara:strand:- start:395 stop:607 length:213 start_codon:yes stop_codon:yes gene_type:complete
MLKLIKNKIIQAIVNSDAFADAIINICDQHYTDIDNLNNEIENAIKSHDIVTRDDLGEIIEDRLALMEEE